MIKNIILDVGNVLADYCWKKHLDSFGFSEETADKVAKATVLDADWEEYDRGVLTGEEILNRFIANDPSVEKEIRQFNENISGVIEVYPYTKQWITDLKTKGLGVYILSNYGEKCYRECGSKMDFVELVDGAVFSWQEKVIKPDDAIYQRILKRYHLVPEECVFFDDREVNIEGARENGIHGIVFENYEQANEELEKLMDAEK